MAKRKTKRRKVSVYSNLAAKHRTKKDSKARKKAEYLATLPKHPVKRIAHRLHPKRVAKYWFSKEGLITAAKIVGVASLVVLLLGGALFAYYRKDLDQIRPETLAQRVKTTVTKYYDRNDKLLWEDKGTGNYKLVVKSDEISDYMKQATVAIEDKDFYQHAGISVTGMTRAAISNLQGNSAQGGSTLTQQLVKQVFFSEQADQRGLSGIPRKIKEMILAIEVERMYNKEQILTLYLNESPYGGRRNGVESAAETYFGKHADKLNLAESALLAAIPNQPGLYNPYNVAGHDALIARQQKTLDSMADMGYITKDEAAKAKEVPILDKIKPLTDQLQGVKAPHFVLMVRQELERELGKAVVGNGGLVVKTTLDLDIQKKLESEMNAMFKSQWPGYAGFTNGAATVEDVKTGQIIALIGSRNFNYEGYGQDNAATAFIQPGSSIKPFVYAQLFEKQPDGKPNFGSGTVLSDTPTTFGGTYKPQNADGKFKGNITIRQSLDWSRNIPALKAMAIAGKDETWKTIRDMGNQYYCTQGADQDAGLASAIGGCGTRMIDHVNALASLGRMGVYMPQSSILEVKSGTGETLKKYKSETKQVINSQAAYVVNDILGDAGARAGLFGASITPVTDSAGFRLALKTGTSDINRKPKDIWTVAYTPQLSMAVWLGNPDTSPLTNGNSSIPAYVLDPVMAYALNKYKKAGADMAWFKEPSGIQHIRGEVYPSYYDKNKQLAKKTITFDRVSKKKATDCTPDAARVDVEVTTIKDPYTGKDVVIGGDGYDATKDDDVHKCGDAQPDVAVSVTNSGSITVSYQRGRFQLKTLTVSVNGNTIKSVGIASNGTMSFDVPNGTDTPYKVTATVTDVGYYTASDNDSANGGGSS